MQAVLHTVAIYVVLLAVFRLAGKRTIAEIDTFDMVILLIISESTQQALVGDDDSLTTAFTVIVTLVGCGVLLAFLKQRSPRLSALLDGLPVVILKDGELLKKRMDKLRVDEDDIIEAAHLQGVARMDQIRYAILERTGEISIIPKK